MAEAGRSVREPRVYDLARGIGEDANHPCEINNSGALANFVHVQDRSEQTLTGASDVSKCVGGTGGLKALLDLAGVADLLFGGIAKRPPSVAIPELLADNPQRGFLLFVLFTDIAGEAGPKGLINVRLRVMSFGALDPEDVIVEGRGKYGAKTDLPAVKVVADAINAGATELI